MSDTNKEDIFQKAYSDALRRSETMRFLKWAEATHPAYLNNLKEGYRRHLEAKKDDSYEGYRRHLLWEAKKNE
tara:strand:+ start:623 stop:841 length:219 start_codon:yes stop_codon:yes gene_type:complete